MTTTLELLGLGYWSSGLPGVDAAGDFLRDGREPEACPRRPAPDLLAANERRRAPDTVALALEVAMQACRDAGADPARLPSVFASTHGELSITDFMGRTLAESPGDVSPTKFHNSVHNAAAGYWTIGAGCMAPATALSAFEATLAEGLLEAAAQVAAGEGPVLLVAYDAASTGPLASVSASEGLLGAAFVLGAAGSGGRALAIAPGAGEATPATGALARRHAGNAMAPVLPLVEALLGEEPATLALPAGPGRVLTVSVGARA